MKYSDPIGARVAKTDVWQGTLALMILETLRSMRPQHGYGIFYPALLKLEQEGYISPAWGLSENKGQAKFYRLTRAGRKQVEAAAREWGQTTAILARFRRLGDEGS